MPLRLFLGEEQTGGLDDVLRADLAPREVGGIALGKDRDLLPVDDDRAVGAADFGAEFAVHGVVLQHIGEIVGRTQVVDADDFDFGVIETGAQDHAADTTEPVDADLNAHKNDLFS